MKKTLLRLAEVSIASGWDTETQKPLEMYLHTFTTRW